MQKKNFVIYTERQKFVNLDDELMTNGSEQRSAPRPLRDAAPITNPRQNTNRALRSIKVKKPSLSLRSVYKKGVDQIFTVSNIKEKNNEHNKTIQSALYACDELY